MMLINNYLKLTIAHEFWRWTPASFHSLVTVLWQSNLWQSFLHKDIETLPRCKMMYSCVVLLLFLLRPTSGSNGIIFGMQMIETSIGSADELKLLSTVNINSSSLSPACKTDAYLVKNKNHSSTVLLLFNCLWLTSFISYSTIEKDAIYWKEWFLVYIHILHVRLLLLPCRSPNFQSIDISCANSEFFLASNSPMFSS